MHFFNGELSRIVVAYDQYKVEGLAAEDMIEGISKTYGTATMPTAKIALASLLSENTPVLARWEDSEYSYDLVRVSEWSPFAMIPVFEATRRFSCSDAQQLRLNGSRGVELLQSWS